MNTTTFTILREDGTTLYGYRWLESDSPRAIVQVAHGMGEHALRYARLAEALVERGYAVYAHDHRGHGRTAGGAEGRGVLGVAGWDGLVDDIGAVSELARQENPGIPLVVLGHSMGSFALQQYLLDRSADLDVAVLSGTSAADMLFGQLDTSQPVDLATFNAPFEPGRTGFEWLSRDDVEVDLYVADPDCGFSLDVVGFAQMAASGVATADPSRLAAIRHDLPIYLFSGTADPVAGGGALVEFVASRYREAGVRDVTVALYPDARHETLNEVNRDDVTADLLAWLDRTVS